MLEETILHRNTNQIKHDVQFLYTIPSKLTIIALCEHQLAHQQFNISTRYPKHHRHSFSSRSGTPSIASDIIGSSSVTGRTSDYQCLGSFDDRVFVAKLSRVRN